MKDGYFLVSWPALAMVSISQRSGIMRKRR